MKNYIKILLLSLVVFSCKPENPPPPDKPADETVSLTFKFTGKFNDIPMSWLNYVVTHANDTIRVARLKYLLSNFVLEKSNGEFVKLTDAYGFISLADRLDSFTFKNIPKGDYKSLRFEVGLDSAINHGNPQQWSINHPLNPSVNDMHWGWSGGYIFQIVEGYYKSNGLEKAFSYHVANDVHTQKHALVYDFTISKNSKFEMAVEVDKIFYNAVDFSIKNDGDFSHSGDPDLVMDKFFKNAGGTIQIDNFK
ncbi:MAG: MbnP family protein [Bacteroidota bacterium]